jgi:hypothetical protein
MSRYLIDRIDSLPNVEVVTGCEISALEGTSGVLHAITTRDRAAGPKSSDPPGSSSRSLARIPTPTGCEAQQLPSTSGASS